MEARLREEFKKRVSRCREEAISRNLDALLIIGKGPDRAGDLKYLANHKPLLAGHPTLYNFRGRGFGALILPVEDTSTLIVTTPFYEEDVVADEVRVSVNLPEAIANVITRKGLSKAAVGLVGEDVLPLSLYKDITRLLPNVKFVDVGDLVMNMRAVKSHLEIEFLSKGAEIADKVATALREYIDVGLTEREVATFIQEELSRYGVEETFGTCQSGPKNSGEPMIHGGATDRRIKDGDMVHMEINGKYKGYMIDICRSTVVGRMSTKQKDILELIVQMLEASIESARPGLAAEELERITGELALKHGFNQHHTLAYGGPGTYLGHGIGLGTDEPPILAKGMKTRLRENMVLAIEPGLYHTEVGGARIEDEILITKRGAIRLNKCERIWW